jgi:hypothetical protein
MTRQIGRLTGLQIRRAKPGWLNDGGGLYLRADKGGGRYWYFRWGAGGAKYVSLGPIHTITLQRAREKAKACRELLIDGRDPKTERAAARLEALRTASFSQAASPHTTRPISPRGAGGTPRNGALRWKSMRSRS